MKEIIKELRKAIEKYKASEYSESDFHLTITSIEIFITENELYELKDFLISTESSLELIDFMVEKKSWRDEYLNVICKIEVFLDDFGSRSSLNSSMEK